jgi:hypothetical protein
MTAGDTKLLGRRKKLRQRFSLSSSATNVEENVWAIRSVDCAESSGSLIRTRRERDSGKVLSSRSGKREGGIVKRLATIQQLERIVELTEEEGPEKYVECVSHFTNLRSFSYKQARLMILCLEGRWSGFSKNKSKSTIKETKAPYQTDGKSASDEMLKSLENIRKKLQKGK